jgi:replicative DNA helicase
VNVEESGQIFRYPPEMNSLNRLTGGVRRGDFIVQAATTNTGKTVFALQQLIHWAKQRHKVLFVNTEMAISKCENLLLKKLTGLSYLDIEHRKLEDQAAIIEAARELERYPYEILRPRVWKPSEVAAIQARDSYDIIIYDHITRISTEPGVIADAARELRNIALEYDCVVICLQQLNDPFENALPSKNHLRYSKTPGEEADQLILLHRAQSGGWVSNDATVIIDKSRVSNRSVNKALFNERYIRFEDPE